MSTETLITQLLGIADVGIITGPDFDTLREAAEALRAQAAQSVPSRELSGWCQYVGGMVSGYIRMTGPDIASMDDEKLTAAIAGIIERRLWAMPKPETAPQPSAVPDGFLHGFDTSDLSALADGLDCYEQQIDGIESTTAAAAKFIRAAIASPTPIRVWLTTSLRGT